MPETKKFEISPSVAIIITGVIVAAAIVFVGKFPAQAEPQAALPPSGTVKVPLLSADDHVMGSLNAPIVLIEYSDFQCPFCQRIHPTLKRIVDESQGKVAWTYRHFPLESIHPQARMAALASECIAEQLGSEGFWQFADEVFANQQGMGEAQYQGIAAKLGADVATFSSCLANETYASKVDTQTEDAQLSGGAGTPFTIVAGGGMQVPLSGALPYEQIKSVINALEKRL